jgi:hypothetical protein
VEIYVTAVEALKKKERQDETQFTTKIGGKNFWLCPSNRCSMYWIEKLVFPDIEVAEAKAKAS